jgi:hypothetical protein
MKSRGHGCKLSRKCEAAVAALLSAPTVKAAAKQVGVTQQALQKWLKIPAFAAMVRDARDQAFQHALGRLQAESSRAVDVLARVLRKRTADDKTKVRAALGLLAVAFKGVELHELIDRLAAVEQELACARASKNHATDGVNGKVRT